MRSLPFGKPLSSDEMSQLTKAFVLTLGSVFGAKSPDDLKVLKGDPWSTVREGRVFIAHISSQGVQVAPFAIDPFPTIRKRLSAYKPDGFLALFLCPSIVNGQPCTTIASVLMLRSGETVSTLYSSAKGWRDGRALEIKGSLVDLLYRGMGDVWNLPVSEEGIISLGNPTDPDTIQASLECVSRVGQPITTDITPFTSRLLRTGLIDLEFELALRHASLPRGRPDDPPPPADVALLLLEKHVGCCWAVGGMPIYELTSSFLALLLLTDPSNVPASALHMPFDTFFVRVPTPFWKVEGGDPSGDITGFWVHKFTRDGACFLHIRVILAHQTYTFAATLGFPDETSTVPLGKWLQLRIDEDMKQAVWPGFEHLWRAILRTVVNLSLYLTEKKAEEGDKPTSRKKPARKASEISLRPTTTVLCREVKLDRTLLDAAKAWTEAQRKNRTGWKLHSRYVVTGHWRNQVCGTRQKTPDGKQFWVDHHPKWIRPHVKGEGPLFRHVFKLGDASGQPSIPTGDSDVRPSG